MSLAQSVNRIVTGSDWKIMRVTAVGHNDTTVNLDTGSTIPLVGVPCLASYWPRNIGDSVLVGELASGGHVVVGPTGKPLPTDYPTRDEVRRMIQEHVADLQPIQKLVSFSYGQTGYQNLGVPPWDPGPNADWIKADAVWFANATNALQIYAQVASGVGGRMGKQLPGIPTRPPGPYTIEPLSRKSWMGIEHATDLYQGNVDGTGQWIACCYYAGDLPDTIHDVTTPNGGSGIVTPDMIPITLSITVARTLDGPAGPVPVWMGVFDSTPGYVTASYDDTNPVHNLKLLTMIGRLERGERNTFTLPDAIRDALMPMKVGTITPTNADKSRPVGYDLSPYEGVIPQVPDYDAVGFTTPKVSEAITLAPESGVLTVKFKQP